MTRTDHAPTPGTRGPGRFRAPEDAEQRGSVGRALAAGLALLVLVVGVPLALWVFTGPPPFPTGLPSRDDLTQPVGTDAVLVVLRLVVWLAWLQFTVSVVVEAVSMVRGRGLPLHVPFGGLTQQLARTLVSALLVGGVVAGGTTSATAATLGDAPTTTAASVVHEHGTAEAGGDVAEAAAPTDRVDAAAEDRRGARVAHTGVPSTMTDVIGKKVYVVQPPKGHYHDNLWDIAERHLGDGRRWNDIFRLNDGREQPDGRTLVMGRLIQPGWVLVMPDDAVGLERVKEVPPPPARGAGHDAQETADGGTPEAGHQVAAQDTGAVTDAEPSGLAADLLAGGLFTAGLLGALAAERRRRRAPLRDPEAAEAEVALRVGADEDRAQWLDRALRGLSGTCRNGATALPPVYAAVVDDERIDLRLAPARPEAPAPWTPVDEGRTWRLHRGDGDPNELGHAPFPGLVCLGRDVEGRDVLLDLESVGGVVSVAGDGRLAAEVVSAMAVQLATNPWTDDQHVHGHHLAPVLSDIAGERLTTLEDVEPLLSEVAQSRPDRSAGEVLTGRLARRPGVAPMYVVLGSEPSAEVAERLSELTASGARGFGAVSVGSLPGTRLHVDETGTLQVPLLDLTVEAVRLSHRSADEVALLFTAARTEQPPLADGRVSVAPTGRAGDDAHWSAAEVRVGVLGPVETRTPGALDPTRVPLATEIAAFLALQPTPVHPSVLAASIWPRGVTPEVRDATIERVREWLGSDVDGNHHLRADDEGRVSLGPGVAVDWSAFCELALRARSAASSREEAELLRRALQLVRGELVEDAPAGRYSWLARTDLESRVPAVVSDAAHRLAELCRMDDDPEGAAVAARAALRLAPEAQLLWRDLVRADFDRAGAEAAAETVGRMTDALVARGAHVEAETEALVEDLLPSHRSMSG